MLRSTILFRLRGLELIGLFRVQGNDTILDLGCGTGKLTVELGILGPRTGLDPSPEMLSEARKTIIASSLRHL